MKTRTIRTLFVGTAIATALGAPLGFAAASELIGIQAGKTAEEVKTSLTTQGYEVRKVETEDGELEAYALKDGKRFEIYVDPTTGAVSRIKSED